MAFNNFLGYLVFDLPKYERDKQVNAHNNAMVDRDDYEDGDLNEPSQPEQEFDGEPEEINVEEELVRPMSQLNSQERFQTPSNSQQNNSQQTAQSMRSQVKDFKSSIYKRFVQYDI